MTQSPDSDRHELPEFEEASFLSDAGVRFIKLADDLPFVPAGPYEPRFFQLLFRWAILVALAVAVFWPSLVGGWMWLDDRLIGADVGLRTLRGLGSIWSSPLGGPPPGVRSAWWLEFHLFGRNAWAWRAASLGMHVSAGLMIWLAMRRLGVTAAWLIAAVFVVHPVTLGNVAWPSRQGELIGAFAAASAFWAFLVARQIQPAPDERSWTDPAFYVNRDEDESPRWPWLIFVPAVVLGLSVGSAAGLAGAAAGWLVERRYYAKRSLPIAIVLLAWALLSLAARVLLSSSTATVTLPIGTTGPAWVESAVALPMTLWHAFWPAALPLLADRGDWASVAWLVVGVVVTLAVILLPVIRRTAWTWSLAGAAVLAVFHGVPMLRAGQPMVLSADLLPYVAAFAVIAGVIGLLFRRLRRHTSDRTNRAVRWVLGLVLIGALSSITATRAGEFAGVDDALQATLRLNPDCIVARTELAASYLNENFLDEAGNQLDRVPGEKRDVHWLLARGRVFDAQKDFAQSVHVYQLAQQKSPLDRDTTIALAEALTNVGELGQAAALYDAAIAGTKSADAGLLTNAGVAQMRIGQPKKAAEYYEKALAVDPQNVPAHLNLSNTLFELGEFEASAGHLQEVVKLDPRNYVAYLNAGVVLTRLNDFVKAERMFRVAINLNPQSAEAFAYLGVVLARQGKESEAVWSFNQAVKIDPDHEARQWVEQLRNKPAKP
ncbi:MAG: tetratricopeptide repeat protein [Tepidisphaeraceae bacterium]